jgi:FkbM family methyltransferase
MPYLLERTIKTVLGNDVNINSNNLVAKAHFDDPRNYADFIINQINTEKIYQPYLKPNQVIFDIGANVGLFSLHCADSGSIIYAFEPTPQHYNLLCEFTNKFDNIKPINVAISDNDAKITFYMSDANTTMNSISNRYGKSIEVNGRSILSFIKENNIDKVDFIKCDIEGSEMIALTYETVKPLFEFVDKWFIEVHNTPDRVTRDNRMILKHIFETVGYKCEEKGSDTLYIYK